MACVRMGMWVALALCLGAAASSQAQTLVGWRTDGSGRYPQAKPPTDWGMDRNVAWTAPMPTFSNATVILVKDLLFTCAEPGQLLCLDRVTGAARWHAELSYADCMTAAQSATATKDLALADELDKQIREADGQVQGLNKRLKEKPDDAALKKQIGELNAKLGDWRKQQAPLAAWRTPPTHPLSGYTSATPCSDGQYVYVIFGNGLAASYTLEGQRRWVKFIEKPPQSYGHSTSPLLVDGKLLVVFNGMTALNPATGEVLWRATTRVVSGSPVSFQIGKVWLVATAGGEIVRASDGVIVASNLHYLEHVSPVVQDGCLYLIQGDARCYELPRTAADSLTLTKRWQVTVANDTYYASPVIHEGLLYTCTANNQLTVLDAKTGAKVLDKVLDLGKGTVYPSVTLAGNLIYVSNDNGTTSVLQPGRVFKELARPSIEPFRGSLVFADNHVYVRGEKHLYCVGKP